MANINVTRDKQFLYFALDDGKKGVRYDLQKLQMQKLKNFKYKENVWVNISSAHDYFHGCSIYNLKSDEPKFVKMIETSQKINDGCKSVSTFISRLGDALVGEEYDDNNIEYECDSHVNQWGNRRRNVISKPLSFYDKHFWTLFRLSRFKVTVKFESVYINNKVLFDKMAHVMSSMNLAPKNIKLFFEAIEYRYERFVALVKDYNYDMKALINYIFNYLEPFENIKPREALELLNDYYRMGHNIGRELKKYPKYLKSMHDIIMANYTAYKQEYDEIKFERLMKLELEYKNHKYCMLVPKKSKDIIVEGTNLNHCVSSYVDKILREETYIMFMRMIGLEESSLVTIEYKENAIVQAKGSYNRELIKEEKEFLQEYCKNKKIEMKVYH